ncbi:MAG: hypothetical protein R2809_09910 [Flavobacteriales bacterium]
MKPHITLFALLILTLTSSAQHFQRRNNESKEDFVTRFLGPNTFQTGPVYEFSDSSSTTILYFQIVPLSPIPEDNPILEPFAEVTTLTLFNALHSTDKIKFTKVVVDTLDRNSGCCPCHQPAEVDRLILPIKKNESDYQLVVIFPVRNDCNSVTHSEIFTYKNLLARIREE